MIAFAYYRLPYLHHATYVAQHEGEPEVLSSVAELNGKEGFVIAPFAPSSECPVVLMHPDESKLLSAEGAENASQRGTSYVVTQQDLRRDVAESTSGRSMFSAGQHCSRMKLPMIFPNWIRSWSM